ncbi:MAG: SH3 domain-containing C40 family peptidase [Bacteroidota bacterium]
MHCLLLHLLAALSISGQAQPADSVGLLFQTALQGARRHFAPDRRVALFDIAWNRTADAVVLHGEVDNPAAKDSVLELARAYFPGGLIDSVLVLPHPALGTNTFGIVVLSVANVRSRPGESEELATQVTMGQVVKVLKKGPGYYYVQSYDGYLGWLGSDAFQWADRAGVDEWAAAPKTVLTSYFEVVRERPSAGAQPVCDAVIGNIFRAGPRKRGWVEVRLADGRAGFLPAASVQSYAAWQQSRNLTGANIERTARMFVGVPYLWGGTSSKGMDCSGFTKTVFRLNGHELSRDASQQVLNGRDIDAGKEFENLAKGDLMFFGRKADEGRPERITHVAIYLENRRFIHSSGRVQFGSFDPASPEYDDYNLKRFVRARRIIPAPTVPER